MRWGLGPVFYFEWLTASRRWQLYAGRAFFVALLLAALALTWWSRDEPPGGPNYRSTAALGASIFSAVVGTQLTLVLLAAPAATAGAVCLDKARGSLLHVLVTDLSNAEVVFGKLTARLMPVLGLVLAGMPVLFLCLLLGGIDPQALPGAYLVTLGVAVLGCALALLLSVWGTRTHEVLFVTYFFWLAALLAYPVASLFTWMTAGVAAPEWPLYANPYWLAFGPVNHPGGDYLREQAGFLGVCLTLAAGMTLVAVWRVRAVTVRQAGRQAAGTNRSAELRRRWRWRWGPSLDRNPLLWRERQRRQGGWTTGVWAVFWAIAVTVAALSVAVSFKPASPAVFGLLSMNALLIGVGLLLVVVGAVTALADERAQGSLDVLLTTPLSVRSILWGKWRGAYRPVPWMAVLAGATGAAVSLKWGGGDGWDAAVLLGFLVLAYGAAFTSLGLALALWIARFGRAVVAAVVLYALLCFGWFFLIISFYSGTVPEDGTCEALLVGSPLSGALMLTQELQGSESPLAPAARNLFLTGATLWLVGYAAAAFLLFELTLWTFPRCLGLPVPGRRPARPRPDVKTQSTIEQAGA